MPEMKYRSSERSSIRAAGAQNASGPESKPGNSAATTSLSAQSPAVQNQGEVLFRLIEVIKSL